ncbi:MAG: hypothetical protein LBB11_02900 [Puniceicoccales bacterium]|jgi:hypothetical protein|nr:hypothetical protein [Puniceicoccales bacterium]
MKTKNKIRLLTGVLCGTLVPLDIFAVLHGSTQRFDHKSPIPIENPHKPHRSHKHHKPHRHHEKYKLDYAVDESDWIDDGRNTDNNVEQLLSCDYGPQGDRLRGVFSASNFQLDNSDSTLIQKEEALADLIPHLIKKHFHNKLQAFVKLTLEGFRYCENSESIDDNCFYEEFFNLSFVDPNTFQLIVQNQRPVYRLWTIYKYADNAVRGENGIIDDIKHNILEETIPWIDALISPDLLEVPFYQPEIFLENVTRKLKKFLDKTLHSTAQTVTKVLFELLKNKNEFIGDSAGCCGGSCSKITPETKQHVISSLGGIMGSVVNKVLGQDFSDNALHFANGIFNALREEIS